MTTAILILGVAGLLLVAMLLVLAASTKRNKGGPDYPYIKLPALFTVAERSFLGVLEQAVPDDYRVMGKVRVADVVGVKAMRDRGRTARAFNRISAKHFDFVICRKSDLSIVCVIELDDQSHQQKKRQKRDQFLTAVCAAASLPLLQVPAKQAYSPRDLSARIASIVPEAGSTAVSDPKGVLRPVEPSLSTPASSYTVSAPK